LAEGGELLARNQQIIKRYSVELLGRSLAELRTEARHATLTTAKHYLHGRGEASPPIADTSPSAFLLSGHQPELFHPGVWMKNFAVNRLARQHGAAAINLIIDTDSAKTPSLTLPGWESGQPIPACPPDDIRQVSIPYDRWTKDVPYEDRPVLDEELFTGLPAAVAPYLRGWNYAPLLDEFWDEARRQTQQTRLLGERLAAARRTFERRWGCHNCEVPMSRLCESEPFAWFACHLLANLPRFHAVYNACVQDYRRANKVRNRTRPLPDLAVDGNWLEVPFWAWHGEHRRRGRLFARLAPDSVALRVSGVNGPTLPLRSNTDARRAVGAWREWQATGFKIRSRALTTTLFARLFVADVFTHGIGGGKYDEITDEIIRRFYQLEPTGYQVLSATLLLPLPSYPAEPASCRRLAAELRDLHWNPQRHVPPPRGKPQVDRLIAEKSSWVARCPSDPDGRRQRFFQLRMLNEELRRLIDGRHELLAEKLQTCQRQVAANEVLQRRDYAFCLYPEPVLKEFLTSFL
jgi:hypothetical protein